MASLTAWYGQLQYTVKWLLLNMSSSTDFNETIQHHILDSHAEKLRQELGPQLSSQFTVADIDGVSTLVFPTAKDLAGFFSDPEYGEKLVADVSEFGDVTSIQFSVGDELVVVQDGKYIL